MFIVGSSSEAAVSPTFRLDLRCLSIAFPGAERHSSSRRAPGVASSPGAGIPWSSRARHSACTSGPRRPRSARRAQRPSRRTRTSPRIERIFSARRRFRPLVHAFSCCFRAFSFLHRFPCIFSMFGHFPVAWQPHEAVRLGKRCWRRPMSPLLRHVRPCILAFGQRIRRGHARDSFSPGIRPTG